MYSGSLDSNHQKKFDVIDEFQSQSYKNIKSKNEIQNQLFFSKGTPVQDNVNFRLIDEMTSLHLAQ